MLGLQPLHRLVRQGPTRRPRVQHDALERVEREVDLRRVRHGAPSRRTSDPATASHEPDRRSGRSPQLPPGRPGSRRAGPFVPRDRGPARSRNAERLRRWYAPDPVGAHGMVTTVALPLFDAQRRPIAALGFGWRRERPLRENDLTLLDTLADLCEQTLERSGWLPPSTTW
ncbi:GAF domain-containing protein [Micromonospora sp. IBHARD004]|uniref:GAF domain-containing protein n=1 Tax=Micromonospora sp. IBHARD004 TaxID=3457764 RepID=UPI004057D408